jgi:hypothetical protein
MKAYTMTKTNDHEWLSTTEVFMTLKSVVKDWNARMIDYESADEREGEHGGLLFHCGEVREMLDDGEPIFHTWVDGFGRKWAISLDEHEVEPYR